MRTLPLLALLLLAACSPRAGEFAALTADATLAAFLVDVRTGLESHDWVAVLALADAEHYETQVGAMGMDEPQYVAELFGLNTVGNRITTDSPIRWAHLEAIREVRFTAVTPAGTGYEVSGVALLADGSERALRAEVVRAAGAWRLAGAVG